MGGEPYDVPGAPEVMDRSAWQERSPDSLTTGATGDARLPYFLLDGPAVIRVSEEGRTTLPLQAPDAESLIDLAVSLDQRTAAAVEPDRRALWILPLDRGITEQRIEGSADRWARASTSTAGPGSPTAAGSLRLVPNGLPEEVAVQPELGSAPITSVHLARDGTRVALVADGIAVPGGDPAVAHWARDRVGATDRHIRVRGS